jgi:hypothetical protein
MRRILIPTAASLLLAANAQAADLELRLTDDAGELEYLTASETVGLQNGRLGVGVLFNEADDVIGQLRLESIGRVSESLSFQVGVKGYVGDLDRADETLTAIGIGGGVRFSLASQIPLSLVLSGFVAPDVLTFGDLEGVLELETRLEAQLTPNAAAFIGYDFFEADVGPRDVDVQDGLSVGVRLGF